jgi:hypothetical protein
MASCNLSGGRKRKSGKRGMFRHTSRYLSSVGSDFSRYGRKFMPKTQRYVRSLTGQVNSYGNKLIRRMGTARRKTLGFR